MISEYGTIKNWFFNFQLYSRLRQNTYFIFALIKREKILTGTYYLKFENDEMQHRTKIRTFHVPKKPIAKKNFA